MEKQKGYVVLEVGYDYNDEYYHTGNYGTTYEAPKKVFIDKKKAKEEVKKLTIKKLREVTLGSYSEEGVHGIAKNGRAGELEDLALELGFNIDDGGDIPKKTTDEQLEKIFDCLKLEFYSLVEVNIE